MTMLAKMLAATALAGFLAAPAAAQYQNPYPYPNPYPQPYPNYPQQTYPYGGGGNVIDQVIGGLLGGNYNANEQQSVSQCAQAAVAQAQNQFGGYSQGYGYQQPYQYGQGYAAPAMRVTSISQVERRSYGLRVRGLIDSGYYSQWNQQNYQNQAYPNQQGYGDLKFRCDVDYRGYVTGVRVERNVEYPRY